VVSRKKILVTGLVAAGLVGLYTLAGFFGVPRLVRAQLQELAHEKLQRTLTLGEIRFNPFTLVLEIHDCTLAEHGGGTLLGFERLLLNLNLASILGDVSLEEIELDAPFARVEINPEGRVNLSELAKAFQEQKQQASKPADSGGLDIELLRVRDGRVDFEDQTPTAPFTLRLRPITFQLQNFSTKAGSGNTFELRAASPANERFEFSGSFTVDPLASKGRLEISNLQLNTPRAYLRDALPFEASSGVVNLKGDYEFAARPQLTLKAGLSEFWIADLGLRARGAASDDIQLKSVAIADARVDLAQRSLTIRSARIAGGMVQARIDAQGNLNLAALAGPSASEPAAAHTVPAEPVPAQPSPDAAPAAAAKPAWSVSAPDLAVIELGVHFEDRQFEPGATYEIAPVNVEVTNYSNAPDAQVDVKVDLLVDGKGKLEVNGKASPATGALDTRVAITNFDLASLQPYIARNTQMRLLGGALTTSLEVARAADGALGIKGNAEVAKLRTVDDALRQDFVTWDLLRATGIDYHTQPARLAIRSLFAQAPYARVIIAPDQTVNVSRILSPPGGGGAGDAQPPKAGKDAAASQAAAPPGARLAMSIGTVRIANGAANFADFWIQPNYAVSLASLTGTITGLDSRPGSRAKVAIDGKVDKYAPARIAGEMNILSQSAYSDITVSMKGVELSTVTPYSGRFAGYKIEKGKLTVDVTYHVENRELKAGQHFVIDQLELGERVESPDAVHLPLKLAVALLKDRNGVIDIDLPLSGSLDDPQFRVGPLIWKAFVGLLTKVATAPFAWLGRLGDGGPEMNIIEFSAGDAALDPAGTEKLASVAKALTERPGLALDVPMAFNPEVDRPALARKLLEARLTLAAEETQPKKRAAAAPEGDSLGDPARRFDLLLVLFREQLGRDAALPSATAALAAQKRKDTDTEAFVGANTELETALLAQMPVTERELEDLGSLRGRAIQDVFLGAGSLDPARVFLVRVRSEGAPVADGKVRAELALK